MNIGVWKATLDQIQDLSFQASLKESSVDFLNIQIFFIKNNTELFTWQPLTEITEIINAFKTAVPGIQVYASFASYPGMGPADFSTATSRKTVADVLINAYNQCGCFNGAEVDLEYVTGTFNDKITFYNVEGPRIQAATTDLFVATGYTNMKYTSQKVSFGLVRLPEAEFKLAARTAQTNCLDTTYYPARSGYELCIRAEHIAGYPTPVDCLRWLKELLPELPNLERITVVDIIAGATHLTAEDWTAIKNFNASTPTPPTPPAIQEWKVTRTEPQPTQEWKITVQGQPGRLSGWM